jgi:hypothetical protein
MKEPKKIKQEQEETPEEEAQETPQEEQEEEAEGTEGQEGVVVPEEFQKAVHGVLKQAHTKHHLSHIRDQVYAKEDEMRKEEMKKEKKGSSKNSKPEEFTSEGMPE